MIPSAASSELVVSKVLIIEDDDFYYESLQRHFKRLRAHVFHAMTLNIALEAIQYHDFDLIVADLGLPDFGSKKEDSGTRLIVLETIINSSPSSLHLVITGRFSLREAEECHSLGAIGYLSKSRLNAPTLATMLERLASEDFIIHSGHEVATTLTEGNPVLSVSEEECLQWVEQRPRNMKRKDLFELMARHFGWKGPVVAEQKYKRARSKVIANAQIKSK